ncbi:hypothetical protein AMATHDRAFT_140429 [Amanita thiersii Skay4041]|uniref:1-phosphatidylinositol-3-phosphate 5-kinase n=1 Tax=Amanita thiersii Skay4041 TaxID=703135 RepID=A0A2A9NSJ7_9AGAR|nr:hypothetical protein AMATHDRAFT_140429 [Amanita thiersii Skay4041]
MTTTDTVNPVSPVLGTFSGQSSRSRSSIKLHDDVTSLTSFNPFSDEDENDKSSYTLVTSIFSRMRSTLSAPLSAATPTNAPPNTTTTNISPGTIGTEQRRLSTTGQTQSSTLSSKISPADRPNHLLPTPAPAAPPLVSLTPAQSEVPSYNVEYDRSPSRNGTFYSPIWDSGDGGIFGTSIPGFPIQDDARSIKTSTSLHRSGSVSKVIRRLRGEAGLSRDYWMDDENCKECYDCKSVFTTWRRKHHCRICGQIFCSRCASNIIKGSRFGQDGMVRVCNICLEKLAIVDQDDEDDRRSIVSSVTSFPAHQLGNESFNHLAFHTQSPFSASQILARKEESFNLFSIAETKQPLFEGVFPMFHDHDASLWETVRENPAPFRRAISDEEKDSTHPGIAQNLEELPALQGNSTPMYFASMPGKSDITLSSVQFPVGSPDHLLDSPRPHDRLRSRFSSHGESDNSTPFIRSRVQSRLDGVPTAEIGWRTRRESTAYAQELNFTSMIHLRTMLRQMLTREEIPNMKEWEETLLRLALKIAGEMTFTALPHRQGEDMDVRRYVKIKKIPGGSPHDSEYVDGAVITKNVAHKQMSRFQSHPRIMLVTFPLEFHRIEGQYMHFGQIVRQEKEYLNNLVARIAALRPHIVLVERSVSRLALDALAKHNISVARSVKWSAISTIARMTQGDVFSSMDRLALEPRLGHCARYRVQTFDHQLIPNRRKTYMRFEGCNPDMGCTIILRGANISTLRRLKKVTRFLIFIVRNLKLETHLWKDSVITLPPFNSDATPNAFTSTIRQNATPTTMRLLTSASQSPESFVDDLPEEEAEQRQVSKRIDHSLEPYTKTFISVSATLRFPPPYPLRRMKELDSELKKAKQAWEDEIIQREEQFQVSHTRDSTITELNVNKINGPLSKLLQAEESAIFKAQIETLPSPNLHATLLDSEPIFSVEKEDDDSPYFKDALMSAPSLVSTPFCGLSMANPLNKNLFESLRTVEDIRLESRLSLIRWQHEEQRRIWEWYLRKNKDDFVMENYQRISLWEYTIPIDQFAERRACFAPRLTYITFYGENDCTLGQYVEKAVVTTLGQILDSKAICSGKGCDQPLSRHCKVYVHNETRLFVAVEQWDVEITGRPPTQDHLTTWSACRVCHSATPFIPVSEEMQRYSFAKFLELHFYPADVKLVQGAGCEHNIYQHHIRYFSLKGMTVRFQTDPVTMQEIVYPPFRIRVRPETQLEVKNADYEKLHRRNLLWYSGLIDDLRLISIDAATGDEKHDASLIADINSLIMRAETERDEITKFINRVYKESSPTDTIALNKVHSYRQEKIVAWQQDFDRLPKPRPPTATEKATKRSSAFNSVRSIWPRRSEVSGIFDTQHVPSSSVSEAEEATSEMRSIMYKKLISPGPGIVKPDDHTEVKSGDSGNLSSTMVQSESIHIPNQSTATVEHTISEPESDSTIGAPRENASPESGQVGNMQGDQIRSMVDGRVSRLPRRTANQPSVAELVKRYQDFLPATGVQDLAQTALSPRILMSESEQEYSSPFQGVQRRTTSRSKAKQHLLVRKGSVSDFEQSYAANIAPRYLTRPRRAFTAINGSRIPGPVTSLTEIQGGSRRSSPEKRSSTGRCSKEVRFSRPPSPLTSQSTRTMHGKAPGRRDKLPRNTVTSNSKSTFRKPPSATGVKVSNIAKHFERLSRDAERSKNRYNVIRGKRARPVTSARARVEVLESVQDAIKDETDVSDISSEADDEGDGNEGDITEPSAQPQTADEMTQIPEDYGAKTAPPLPSFLPTATEETTLEDTLPTRLHPPGPISLPPSPFLASTRSKQEGSTPPTSDVETAPLGTERGSILKALSGFWLQPPPSIRLIFDIDDPMNDPEHIFNDSSIIVRTDEPTSIIALALDSPQYREMLAKSRAEKRAAREARLTEGGEAFMPDDRSVAESTSTWGVVNLETSDLADPMEELKMPSSKSPYVITFDSGGLIISCTVLYPEQFDALRKAYHCDKTIIESLSRCVKWNASGGKSGSAFLKTKDDRFIAKELSRPELQTMETFAPAYFEYMSSAVSSNRPTLLAKVFGCYKLTFKKTGNDKVSGRLKSFQMNLLVMENLFYDRRFTKIYDLKGSTRNRHVQSTGRENEVLLDENLVETAHLNPFYLREHSKRILRGALYNDSKFLADINVMDYSLVCGVDSQKNELVVGIVDYQRTYTWDKKLESWVKESAFLGGGKGEPTIVTPKQYRQRFLSAMERYFPLIPDRWMKQRDTPEEDSNSLSELWPDW